jgi:hypothetical protein
MRTFWVGLGGTIAIAITLVFTGIAANAAKQAAEIAEMALTDLERPYVVARFTRSGLIINESGQIGIESPFIMQFVNLGRTPALLFGLFLNFDRTSGTAMPYPLDPLAQTGPPMVVGSVSADGWPFEIKENMMERFGGDVLTHNARHLYGFFCLGHLRYSDIFGNTFILGFCAKFNAMTNEFVLFGDTKFNYTRQETWAKRNRRHRRNAEQT